MYLLPRSVFSASGVFRQRLGNFYRSVIVPTVSRRANRIITVSEYSRQEIIKYLRVSPGVVRVIHEGIDANFRNLADGFKLSPGELTEETLDSPYILVLGAGDPRKNTLGAVRAYASCWRELPNRERLVIVGMRDWRSSEAYRLALQLNLVDRVLFTGYVSEPTLVWLYSSARCFLYPTLYEGFGFPLLEAMACGTPVITSDCTSVSEVAGDAAILIDPSSTESISNALLRLLRDEPLRLRLIQQGKSRVQKFTWESTVQKTLDVYVELRAIGTA
jgi:glycosyltransferase involved in cell wall biosynthesis